MKCQIHVYLLNEDFSPEHAEAHFGGEESENNPKYEWEDELVITSDVTEIVEHEKVAFPLQGEMPDGKPFRFDVENMHLLEVRSADAPSVFVGASESILDAVELTENADAFVLKIFLKDFEPMANPIPGIYIASQEFPVELIPNE